MLKYRLVSVARVVRQKLVTVSPSIVQDTRLACKRSVYFNSFLIETSSVGAKRISGMLFIWSNLIIVCPVEKSFSMAYARVRANFFDTPRS